MILFLLSPSYPKCFHPFSLLIYEMLFCRVLLLGFFVPIKTQLLCGIPYLTFFSEHFVKVQMLHLYCSTGKSTAGKNYNFLVVPSRI